MRKFLGFLVVAVPVATLFLAEDYTGTVETITIHQQIYWQLLRISIVAEGMLIAMPVAIFYLAKVLEARDNEPTEQKQETRE